MQPSINSNNETLSDIGIVLKKNYPISAKTLLLLVNIVTVCLFVLIGVISLTSYIRNLNRQTQTLSHQLTALTDQKEENDALIHQMTLTSKRREANITQINEENANLLKSIAQLTKDNEEIEASIANLNTQVAKIIKQYVQADIVSRDNDRRINELKQELLKQSNAESNEDPQHLKVKLNNMKEEIKQLNQKVLEKVHELDNKRALIRKESIKVNLKNELEDIEKEFKVDQIALVTEAEKLSKEAKVLQDEIRDKNRNKNDLKGIIKDLNINVVKQTKSCEVETRSQIEYEFRRIKGKVISLLEL